MVVLIFFSGSIINDLSSKNENKAQVGMIRAEELLGSDDKPWEESSLKTVRNGTKINKKAFEDLGKPKEEIPADAGEHTRITITFQHFPKYARYTALASINKIQIRETILFNAHADMRIYCVSVI